MEELWRPGIALRLIGVGMSGFEGDGAQQERLFDPAQLSAAEEDVRPIIKDDARRRGLIEATDTVRDRFGEGAVQFGRELRSAENTTGSSSKNPADYK